MKRKMKLQIGTDCAMTVLLLILMAKQLTGETAHEWLGAGMFVLWVFHHVLNRKWYGRIAKGKYSPFRLVQFVVNACLFAAMLGTMVSGVILSRRGFAFLPLSGGVAFARPLHIFCAFWLGAKNSRARFTQAGQIGAVRRGYCHCRIWGICVLEKRHWLLFVFVFFLCVF